MRGNNSYKSYCSVRDKEAEYRDAWSTTTAITTPPSRSRTKTTYARRCVSYITIVNVILSGASRRNSKEMFQPRSYFLHGYNPVGEMYLLSLSMNKCIGISLEYCLKRLIKILGVYPAPHHISATARMVYEVYCIYYS